MSKRTKILIFITALAAAISAVVVYLCLGNDSLAYNSSNDMENNKFEDGRIYVEVNENVDNDKTGWQTGSNLKVVTVLNYDRRNQDDNTRKSTVNSVVRVAIIPRWVDKDDESKEIPWAGDVDCLDLSFMDEEEDESFMRFDAPEDPNEKCWLADGSDIKGTRYFYYNQLMKPGDKKTKSLLNSFSLNLNNLKPASNNETANIMEKYKNYKLIIDVKAESVIANTEAIQAAWRINTEDENDKIGSMLKELCNLNNS